MKCDSPSAVAAEVNSVRDIICVEETEESWDTIAKGISRLTSLCAHGACDFPTEFVASIRPLYRYLNSAMNSERSRLSGNAIELMTALASGLGPSFEPLLSLCFPTIVNLCARTNKVFSSRGKTCILAIIENTQLPAILGHLSDALKSKMVSLRLGAAEGILACMNCFNPPDLEKEARARMIEDSIRMTARDASADVRKAGKKIFDAYRALMPYRVDTFVAPLTPVIKKYLDVHVNQHASRKEPNKTAAQQRLVSSKSAPSNLSDRLRAHSRTASSSKAPDIEPPQKLEVAHPQASDETRARRPGPDFQTVREKVEEASKSSAFRSLMASQASSHALASEPPSRAPSRNAPESQPPVRMPSRAASRTDTLPSTQAAARWPKQLESSQTKSRLISSQSQREVGGARRVPIPSATADPSKNNLPPKVSRPAPPNPSASNHVPLKAGPSTSKPQPLKATGNPAVARSGQPIAVDKSQPTSISEPTPAIPQSNSQTETVPSRSNTIKSGGVTKPTLSQLSRMNANVAERKAADVQKRTGGVPPPSRQGNTIKALVIKGKETVAPAHVKTKKNVKLPESIPLPPSPEPVPTHVPLPPSPTPPLSEESEAAQSVEVLKPPQVQSTVDVDKVDTNLPDAQATPELESMTDEATPRPTHTFIPEPPSPPHYQNSPGFSTKTPITALVASIQRGFLFTPSTPLSPPGSYAFGAKQTRAQAGADAENPKYQALYPEDLISGAELLLNDSSLLFKDSAMHIQDKKTHSQVFEAYSSDTDMDRGRRALVSVDMN